MRSSSTKLNFIRENHPRFQLAWRSSAGRIAVAFAFVSGLLFFVKLVAPDVGVVSGFRRSVLAFIPFALLVLRNAVLEQSRIPRRWVAIGIMGLLYLLAWSWALSEYPAVGLGRPPLLTLSIVLSAVLLATPTIWRPLWAFSRALIGPQNEMNEAEERADKEANHRESRFVRAYQNAHPIVRSIGKWVAREGRWHVIALVAILAFAAFSRLYRLGHLSPAGDEYRHLLAAKHFLTDGYFEYPSSNIVTYILIAVKWLTQTSSLFVLRLPFALLGVGSVFLFYLIGRTIHRSVGLFSAYLVATLPLAIGLSRYIREYEFDLLISAICLLIALQEKFRGIPWRLIVATTLFGTLDYLNSDSRFHAAFVFFLMFVGLRVVFELSDRMAPRIRYSRTLVHVLIGIAAIALSLLALPVVAHLTRQPTPELGYLFLFNFSNSNATWYPSFVPFLLPMLFFFLGAFRRKQRSTLLAFLAVAVMILLIYLYYFYAPRRFQVRYLYLFLPFLIPLLASGMQLSWSILQRIFRRVNYRVRLALGLLLMMLIFSPTKGIVLTLREQNGSQKETSQVAYYDDPQLIEYISNHHIDVTKVITTVPWVFSYYYDLPFLRTDAEKSRYIFFPWSSEYVDREGIYGINGYWDKEDIAKIKLLIQQNQLQYVIVHALPQRPEEQYKPTYLPSKIGGLELEKIIDSDKTFGYYIYRVEVPGVFDSSTSPGSESVPTNPTSDFETHLPESTS